MASIDQKVVEMKLDNRQFEQGVGSTIKTLEKMKGALNLDGMTKGLSDLDKAGKSITFDAMAKGVDAVASKFTTLGIMGVTAIQNISNRITNMGIEMAKTMTIKSLKTGFEEYETQINSVQTILANTASKKTTIQQVNAALDQLNTYSDKTIYNFTEMTRNIGTFTAAGVDLDKSVTAIKGIANLAAVSGSNSQQASTAMYQLSQALASGTVKLMDWNSVVNAGMGGQVFQDALKDTAKTHGVNVDAMIKKQGSFRETLEKGWLTSSVLTETLSKFTGDLNEQQLKSMGYNAKQITEIMELGKMANDAATKVKTLTQLMDTLNEASQSGWAQSWRIIVGDFEEAKVFYTEVSDTLGALIGASADARNKALTEWKALGGRAVLVDSLRNAFQAVVALVTPIREAFREIFPRKTGADLMAMTQGLHSFTNALKIGADTSDKLKRTFKGLFAAFSIINQIVTAAINVVLSFFANLSPAAGGILGVTASLGDFIVKADAALKAGNFLPMAVGKIADAFATARRNIQGFIEFLGKFGAEAKAAAVKGFAGVQDAAQKNLADPITKIGQFIGSAFQAIGSALNKVAPGVTDFFKGFSQILVTLKNNLKNAFSTNNFDIKAIFAGINAGIFTSILLAIRKFFKGLGSSAKEGGASKITEIVESLTSALTAMQNALKSVTLLSIGIAIGILAASIAVLSNIDPGRLAYALGTIAIVFAQLFGAMGIFGKSMGGQTARMIAVTASMIPLAISIRIMASALKKLSEIDPEGLARGLISVSLMLRMMTKAVQIMSRTGPGMLKTAVSLVILGAAMNIMAGAVKQFGNMNWETLAKGLLSFGLVLGALIGFMKLVKPEDLSIGKALSLVIIGAALHVIASAVNKLGDLDIATLGKGLGAMALILATLAGFTHITGSPSGLIKTGVALTIIGAAMHIFASAVGAFGSMDMATLGKGLLGLAASLAIVAGATHIMPKDMAKKAIGLVILGAALNIIAHAVISMSGMSWVEIGKGLTVLAASMIILAVGLRLMKSSEKGAFSVLLLAGALAILVPVIQALGSMDLLSLATAIGALVAIFTVFGLAGLLLGPVVPVIMALAQATALFGVAALATGLGLLLFSMALTAIAVSGAAAGVVLTGIVMGLLGLIPFAFEQIGLGIIALALVIKDGAPAIVGAIVAVLDALLDAVINISPKVGKALNALVDLMIQVLTDNVPKLVTAGIDLLKGLLNGIKDNIGEITTIAIQICVNFINAVAGQLGAIIDAGANLIISFVNGVADACRNRGPELVDAGVNLATGIISGMAKGIANGASRVMDAISSMVSGAVNWAKGILGIASPSKVFTQIGRWSSEGMAIGVEQSSPYVVRAIDKMGVKSVDSMNRAMTNVMTAMRFADIDANPTITPKVDLTNVRAASGVMDKMFAAKFFDAHATMEAAVKAAPAQYAPSQPTPPPPREPDINMTFEQNITSPKELSADDIYRQTNNLLAFAKKKLDDK